MTAYWATIIKSRYNAGAIDADKVESYVPKLITQVECDAILGVLP